MAFMGTDIVLGRVHTNYDIQIIVVILKVTNRPFFQQRTLDLLGKIIMIVLGSHMPNMNYEVYCKFRFGGADSIENDDDIGLSEHLS